MTRMPSLTPIIQGPSGRDSGTKSPNLTVKVGRGPNTKCSTVSLPIPLQAQQLTFTVGRHGEGYHNVAESFYGTEAWDVSYPLPPTSAPLPPRLTKDSATGLSKTATVP